MKHKTLFILHLPEPIHGSSMVGKFIKDSSSINQAFICRYINIGTSRAVDEIGKKYFVKVFRILSIFWQSFYQLAFFRPHLCYLAITSKGPAFYKDSIVALFAKLLGIKLVLHFHNKGVRTRQDKFFDNLLYKCVFKNTDVILISKYLYGDIKKYIPKDRVHYCANGIPDNYTTNCKSQKNNNRPVVILFLSNLIKAKGVFVLLEACKLLQDKNVPYYCFFVGGQGDLSAKQFEQKAKELELNNNVYYVGRKYGKEKDEYFLNADIFALPTYYEYETFGLVLAEAMKFSLPVVSTFEGGIPDVVENGKTGFLVPQKNASALAEKIEQLIINPDLRQQMGDSGRAKFKKEFTLNIFENRLTEILNNIVKTQK